MLMEKLATASLLGWISSLLQVGCRAPRASSSHHVVKSRFQEYVLIVYSLSIRGQGLISTEKYRIKSHEKSDKHIVILIINIPLELLNYRLYI